MQAPVAHTLLAPISEDRSAAGDGAAAAASFKDHRRSLRSLRPVAAEKDPTQQHPRRHTMQLEHRPTSWRRPSSIRSSEGGKAGGGSRQAAGKVENTYRTGPRWPFQLEAAESLLAERLAVNLRGYAYNSQSAPQKATILVQEIKNKVKQQLQVAMQRYKVVVLVTITEPLAASGQAAARALWSADTGDACATAEFRNSRVAASAAVFAFYYE